MTPAALVRILCSIPPEDRERDRPRDRIVVGVRDDLETRHKVLAKKDLSLDYVPLDILQAKESATQTRSGLSLCNMYLSAALLVNFFLARVV